MLAESIRSALSRITGISSPRSERRATSPGYGSLRPYPPNCDQRYKPIAFRSRTVCDRGDQAPRRLQLGDLSAADVDTMLLPFEAPVECLPARELKSGGVPAARGSGAP